MRATNAGAISHPVLVPALRRLPFWVLSVRAAWSDIPHRTGVWCPHPHMGCLHDLDRDLHQLRGTGHAAGLFGSSRGWGLAHLHARHRQLVQEMLVMSPLSLCPETGAGRANH